MTKPADLPFYKYVPKDVEGNLAFRRLCIEKGFADPELAEELWIMCSRDILFYVNVFCWVYSPTISPDCPEHPFITYPFQDELILEVYDAINTASLESRQHRLIDKSRDMGVSWCILAVYDWFYKFRRRRSFLLGSRDQTYVDETGNPKCLFWKLDFLSENQPRWLLPTDRWLGREKDPNRITNHIVNPDNKSVVDGESTTENFGRGDRRHSTFNDELGAVDVGAEIESSVTSNTSCWIVNSTPRSGSYYDTMKASGRFRVLTYHWSCHPIKAKGLYTFENGKLKIIDTTYPFPPDYEFKKPKPECIRFPFRSPWYDQLEKELPEWLIAQEYDMVAAGAGRQFFEHDLLFRLLDRCQTPLHRGDLTFNEDGFRPEWVPIVRGPIKLWFSLLWNNAPPPGAYAVCADVATGKGGEMSSNSTASVIDLATGKKVAAFASNAITPTDHARLCIALCRWFHGAFLIWEANGPGETFGVEVNRIGYTNIFYRQNESSKKRDKGALIPGWWSTDKSKLALLSRYKTALAMGTLQNPEQEAVAECGEYVYNDRGVLEHSKSMKGANPDPTARGQNHGDRVIADALAVRAMEERPAPKQVAETPTDLSTVDPQTLPLRCMARRLAEHDRELAAPLKEHW